MCKSNSENENSSENRVCLNDIIGDFLENYLSDEYSICREERQYVLFLYNILYKCRFDSKWRDSKCVKKIIRKCDIPDDADIQNVFYEVTFMRDIFERLRKKDIFSDSKEAILKNRQSSRIRKEAGNSKTFNQELLEFIIENGNENSLDKYNEIKNQINPVNMGGKGLIVDNINLKIDLQNVLYVARCMMNAKPDIGVIFTRDDRIFLQFIECKFESPERKYNNKETQLDIQDKIARFLVNKIINTENSKRVEIGENTKVTFTRIKEQIKTDNQITDNTISIKCLMCLNDCIMKNETEAACEDM